jgi:probable F420-dependent oxidoreductase
MSNQALGIVPVMSDRPDAAISVDGRLPADLALARTEAPALEAVGYRAAWSSEAAHDAFLPIIAAADTTTTLRLGTGIAVAFARNPMNVAILANDLQHYTHGRFILGLGSQVQAHIERRFGMPWSRPAARMREFVMAIRAVWSAWNDRRGLAFSGDFYTHTLMTPFFDPGPNQFGPPPIFVAAVGPMMLAVAAEVADGVILHSFATERYLREVVRPGLETNLRKYGQDRTRFEVAYPAFVATGRNEAEIAEAAQAVRQQIAFYASTPAYRAVLDVEGWGDAQPEFHRLSKVGDWDAMARLVDDKMLQAFAVVGAPEVVAVELLRRCAGVADRVSCYTPYTSHPETWDRLLQSIRYYQEGSEHDISPDP